jgi:hypothetical protein
VGRKASILMSELNSKVYPVRTNRQNKALHVLFRLLADELNNNGLDMRKTLKPGVEIPWSGPSVKEFLWRPIQQEKKKKKSTTELTTKEIDEVFDTINRHIGERFGIHIPFPSIENLILRYEEEHKND